MSDDAIYCPNCSHEAHPISPVSSSREYLCDVCGNRFHVRMHYLPETPYPTVRLFRGLIEAGKYSSPVKLRIKIERALKGIEEFEPGSLEKQVLAGYDVWDIGLYAESKLAEVKEKAAEHGIEIRFEPV